MRLETDSDGTATRRSFLRGAAAAVGTTAAASAGVGTTTAQSGPDYGDWFSNTGNFDGTYDYTGKKEVTVYVGTDGNGTAYGFGPAAAIRVDPGTKVTWEWTDVRLGTFLVVWFIYAGYLVVYSATERDSDELYAAVYGVIGFVTVPISYLSTRLWTPTFHETTVGNPQVSANIDPLTLVVSIVAVSFLYLYLLGLRVRIHEVEDKIQYRLRDSREQRR